MKKKPPTLTSYYKLENYRCKRYLRLAKAVDCATTRLAVWMAKGKALRNDATILKSKFKFNREIDLFLRRFSKLPKILIFQDKLPVVSFGSYDDKTDRIYLSSAIDKTGAFYSVLFHELTHAAGRKTRVPRPSAMYNTKSEKIKEEMICEFGSLFLSVYFNVATPRMMESFAVRMLALTNTFRQDKRFKRFRVFYYQPYINEAIKALKFILVH